MRCLLEQLSERACARVLVTHDEALARAVCDRELHISGVPSVPVRSSA